MAAKGKCLDKSMELNRLTCIEKSHILLKQDLSDSGVCMDFLKSILSGYSGGKILDVATCGGGFIKDLIGAFKDYDSIIGIDISNKEFEQAREKFKDKKAEFILMDSCQLSFDNETFDTVAISNGLHHMSDIKTTLSEMKRVLKPGGLFIIYEVFSGNQTEKQLSDVYNHNFKIKIDRLKGEIHNFTLEKQEIIDYIEALSLSRYDAYDYHCTECNPEAEEKLNERIKGMDKLLAEVKDHPEYEELKREAEQLKLRFRTVGYECATNLILIGTK